MPHIRFTQNIQRHITIERNSSSWSIVNTGFLGDHCSMIMHDPRPREGSETDGTLYAALGHGHFGVKMHRSTDGGKTWQPIATPVYTVKFEKPTPIP